MRDLCSWCDTVQEIVAERETGEDGKVDRICRSCAEVIGLDTESPSNSGQEEGS